MAKLKDIAVRIVIELCRRNPSMMRKQTTTTAPENSAA